MEGLLGYSIHYLWMTALFARPVQQSGCLDIGFITFSIDRHLFLQALCKAIYLRWHLTRLPSLLDFANMLPSEGPHAEAISEYEILKNFLGACHQIPIASVMHFCEQTHMYVCTLAKWTLSHQNTDLAWSLNTACSGSDLPTLLQINFCFHRTQTSLWELQEI